VTRDYLRDLVSGQQVVVDVVENVAAQNVADQICQLLGVWMFLEKLFDTLFEMRLNALCVAFLADAKLSVE
jgi:hypothetical protein